MQNLKRVLSQSKRDPTPFYGQFEVYLAPLALPNTAIQHTPLLPAYLALRFVGSSCVSSKFLCSYGNRSDR